MSVRIHPTAMVDANARLGRDVEIGAFALVGPNVVLGDGCRLHHHATVEGYTTLGEGCEVYPQAVLGTPPQDLKFEGERTTLEIGRNNIFREMVTAHLGTGNGGGVTRIGDNNLFLVGVHIAHDCQIGSHCIVANYVQFAGHVHIEDHVNLGGLSAVHHFVTIGRHAFIGGTTKITADVPPFVLAVAARGTRSEIRMINGVGLQRSGFKEEEIAALKDAFLKLFSRRARISGVAMRDRVQTLLAQKPIQPHVEELCNFLLRSFAHGRHGRYLESLRRDPVRRDTWRPGPQFQLEVKVIGNGSVKKTHQRKGGGPEIVELSAMADPGWTFAGWNANGNHSRQENPCRLVLEGDTTVSAHFNRAGAATA